MFIDVCIYNAQLLSNIDDQLSIINDRLLMELLYSCLYTQDILIMVRMIIKVPTTPLSALNRVLVVTLDDPLDLVIIV